MLVAPRRDEFLGVLRITIASVFGNSPLRNLRLRPDCEGKPHPLACCTDQIPQSSARVLRS